MNKIKPNTPYHTSIKPDGDYPIIIMLQNGWAKKGMYDKGMWYIIENENKIETNASDIYRWFVKI